MDYKLDIIKDIPYYTNRTDRLFGWFSIYKDGNIIQELNRFSCIGYNEIPKDNISYFGLYGCGFHLISDFNTGSMYIYGKGSKKEFLFNTDFYIHENRILQEPNKFIIQNIQPFQLKGFVYDMPGKSNKEFYMTDKYYAGYIGRLLLDELLEFDVKVYFSINILEHPSSIGIIFNLLPNQSTKKSRPNKNYTFSVVESINERYNNGHESSKSVDRPSYVDFNNLKNNFKKKIIVNYRN
jgi:hypothetical protein